MGKLKFWKGLFINCHYEILFYWFQPVNDLNDRSKNVLKSNIALNVNYSIWNLISTLSLCNNLILSKKTWYSTVC